MCRAWYANVLLHAIGCGGQTCRPLVVGTLVALGFLLKGLHLVGVLARSRRDVFVSFPSGDREVRVVSIVSDNAHVIT